MNHPHVAEFHPSRSDWDSLPKPNAADEELQALLRAYLAISSGASSSSSSSSSFSPTITSSTSTDINWSHCNHPTWAGTPSYIPSTIKPVSVARLARGRALAPRRRRASRLAARSGATPRLRGASCSVLVGVACWLTMGVSALQVDYVCKSA